VAFVRTARTAIAACALIALVWACLGSDPGVANASGDNSDDVSSVDLPDALPVTPFTLRVASEPTARAVIDQLPPLSRLAPLDVFRPPRARA
jgi:hypothetical protein